MVAAVIIENLKKSYGSVQAVRDVSLTIQPGEIFGLLGPNGAGKTTAIRCLCTLATPDSGRLEVMGIPVVEQPQRVRQFLGYIAQEIALDKVLTGRELMQLQADLYHMPKKIATQRIEQMIDLLELADWADQKTGRYSGGLKKRLDLALGLLHQPDVLVLDEPTVGLDIETRSAVWRFLRELRAAGTTILLTSHYLEEVDALADRVAIIDQGKVIASGTPSDLKDKIGGDRITLRIREFTTDEEARSVQAMLAQLPFVQNVIINTAQGNSLNLVVERQTDSLAAVQHALKEAGLPIFSIAQARPSLDDVYLAATGRTLMDAELAAVGQRDLKKEKKQAMKGG
ncbi:MAG: ABC transporter ATP-binding protein [Leptolyngbyaceae cyanobacterium SM2_5_2]|nr:ABC transporter ATP-binding protein [Leptolyngbyaceae cyanobacterium SM2_5_2]